MPRLIAKPLAPTRPNLEELNPVVRATERFDGTSGCGHAAATSRPSKKCSTTSACAGDRGRRRTSRPLARHLRVGGVDGRTAAAEVDLSASRRTPARRCRDEHLAGIRVAHPAARVAAVRTASRSASSSSPSRRTTSRPSSRRRRSATRCSSFSATARGSRCRPSRPGSTQSRDRHPRRAAQRCSTRAGRGREQTTTAYPSRNHPAAGGVHHAEIAASLRASASCAVSGPAACDA